MRTWFIVIIALLVFAVPEKAAVAGDETPAWLTDLSPRFVDLIAIEAHVLRARPRR